MGFKAHKLVGVTGRCDHDPSWWFWTVFVNGRQYADGVCRSEDEVKDALRYAIDHINIDLNLLCNGPDYGPPWDEG